MSPSQYFGDARGRLEPCFRVKGTHHFMDTYSDTGGLAAALAGLVVFFVIFALIAYVLTAIFLTKVFRKAGVQNPAVAWIQIYNTMLLAKLGDMSPWAYLIAVFASGLLANIPVIGFVFAVIPIAVWILLAYRVNLKLGKSPVAFTVVAALFSLIWLGIIAFDSSTWRTGEPTVPAPPWAKYPFLMDTTTFGGVPDQGYRATPAA